MIRAALPYLLTAIVAIILRDAEVFLAAKLFCWRKRRQSQREAKENRELRALQAQFNAKQEMEKSARIAKVMITATKVPYPQLLSGPLIVKARCDHDFLLITKQLHRNFAAQGKPIVDSNFEEN
jgi:hypothetical protein